MATLAGDRPWRAAMPRMTSWVSHTRSTASRSQELDSSGLLEVMRDPGGGSAMSRV